MTIEERIKKGLEGKYEGLANGFDSINKFIFGIQRSTYYLIGGASGTFKTTLCDFMLLNAMQDATAKGIKLTVFYYSYEIDEMTKQCNWLSVLIYQKYGIIVAPETIKGLGRNRMNSDELALVESELPTVKKMFSDIKFRFVPTNPTGIYHELWQHGLANGNLRYESFKAENGEIGQKIVGYRPTDDEAYTLVIMDHLYHLKKERDLTTKGVIDKYSEYCVGLRNLFGFTFMNIQQFNRSLSAIDRQKFKGADISPQESDFKETGNTYQDADVVIGTMSPHKMDMEKCLGYDIKQLQASMLMFKVIKNRLSKDSVAVGLYCNPKAGSFKELPTLLQMNDAMYTMIRNGEYG